MIRPFLLITKDGGGQFADEWVLGEGSDVLPPFPKMSDVPLVGEIFTVFTHAGHFHLLYGQ